MNDLYYLARSVELIRALEFNERFQLLAIIYDDKASLDLAHEITILSVKPVVDRLMRSQGKMLDVRTVGTAKEAIESVLTATVSLTVFDSSTCTQIEVEQFFAGINSNRDLMAQTTTPSSLLVLVPRELVPVISRTAQDIWSCRSVTLTLYGI
jgi:hypothetical protein